MKNRLLKTLVLTVLSCFSALSMGGCGSSKHWTYNYDNFFGMCELTGQLSNGVDTALTNTAVANKAKAMNVKSFRIWMSPREMFIVDDNDNLTLKNSSYAIMKDHMDRLVDAGVRNFDVMYTSFIFPSDYIPSTGYVVPDPTAEYEYYIRFLNLMGKAAVMIRENFPMTTIIEPGNEPDFDNSTCIHKNGYVFGGSYAVNSEYLFTDEEKASIIGDMCWYVRHSLNEAGYTDTKVAMPGLTNLSTAPDFLDLIYDRIRSKRLPAGQEKSDTRIDDYFDYLNFHMYAFDTSNPVVDDEWISFYKDMYQAAADHDDDGRPFICTELGGTDFGYSDPTLLSTMQEKIANLYIDMFTVIKKDFPMCESVFCFRMFNLIHQNVSAGENNFGLFYNPDDPEHPSKAKPAAIAIARYFNGDDFDVSVLDEYVK